MKTYPSELIRFIDSIKDLKCYAVIKNKNTKYYKNYVILENNTSFLPKDVSVKHRIWYVKNSIFEQVKCPTCGKPTKLSNKLEPKFCGVKCSKLYIDPITKISTASVASILGAKTKRNTIINGVSQQDLINDKIKKSFNKLECNGKTTKDNLKEKLSRVMNVKQESGLTLAQESGKKCSITKNTINPKTGLTNSQESGRKTKYSLKVKSFKILNDRLEYSNMTLLSSFDDWMSDVYITYKCNKCNAIRNSSYSYIRCIKCFPYTTSVAEHEVLNFCESFDIPTIPNTLRIISPLELDIYLPNNNLAIEYNGLYYHSSHNIESENKDYHIHKTQECEKQGIQLFHIFENEWLAPQKREIWKSIIRNKLGKSERIYARKTEIRSVSPGDAKIFLNKNHLQGFCNSSIKIGLYLADELVSLMTFGKSRYDKKIDWELLRFCNKIGYSVVGGASRLLKAFRNDNSGSIISYADKRRSNGNLYKQLGFEFSHDSKPNYWYFKNNDKINLFHRSKFQKHKLLKILNKFNSELTESENMYNNGYRKIYDCGNQVWVLT